MKKTLEFELNTTEEELFRDLASEGYQCLVRDGYIPLHSPFNYELAGGNTIKLVIKRVSTGRDEIYYVAADERLKLATVYQPV